MKKKVMTTARQNRNEDICRILVAGDLCPQGRPEPILAGGNCAGLWGPVASLTREYDLSVVDLECPLTDFHKPSLKDGPHLSSDPRCANGIRAGGFHVASLANNHIMDMGRRGLQDTIDALKEARIESVGAGTTLQEATRPLILELNSHRLALLAFAENEFGSANDKSSGAWPVNDIDNYEQIANTRNQGNIVLVLLHGGNEGFAFPNPNLVKRCRHYVRAGANAVVCHHSHVISGYEIYMGSPIFYGTGSLLFDWPEPPLAHWYEGYMVGLELQQQGAISAEIIPHRQSADGTRIELLENDDAERFLQEVDSLSQTIQDPVALAEEWGKFCRSLRMQYLARFLGRNWLEERLLELNIMKPRWVQRRLATRFLNLIRCESHRDVLLELLSSEHRHLLETSDGRNR